MSFRTLVDAAEIARRLDDPGLRIFDCRFSLADPSVGRRAWREGHIPGALHADIDLDLSGPRIPGVTGRHPLPSRDAWLSRVREWGLSPRDDIVVYDDAGGAVAARMWWMMRWIGHESVAVLDGGWQAWVGAGNPVTTALPEPRAARDDADDYANRRPLTKLIEADAIDCSTQVLLDARDRRRFLGEIEPIDPVAGHVPGARSAPSSENLGADGRFLPKEALRQRFERIIGARRGQEIVCYCGSGITAAHNVLALVHAGFDEPRLYAGSWSEWITRPERGVETGPER
ncbi:MAG: sulfurtransferase [Gammaproteobacteria bacterium]